jgi:hypothetical protein
MEHSVKIQTEDKTMSKKHFISLADAIRKANAQDVRNNVSLTFKMRSIETLAAFCAEQNSRFNRERWLGYIAGTNGKNGGSIKKAA